LLDRQDTDSMAVTTCMDHATAFDAAVTSMPFSLASRKTTENSSETMVFGVLAIVVAFFGIAIALLQLRHMRRQKAALNLFELP